MNALELRNVTVRLDGFELDIHEFSLGDGDLVLIVGRNGSGKTTLCKILAGIITKRDGLKGDVRLPDTAPVLLWQDLELFPLSVEGNIRVVNSEVTEELLSRFDLAQIRRSRVDRISGGQRERVAFARALAVPEAECFALDEPTKAADRERVQHVAKAIIETVGMGKSLVVVTHDERLVNEIAPRVNRIFVIEDRGCAGEVKCCSLCGPYTAKNFFTSPSTVFAARFAGYENIFAVIDPERPRTIRNLQVLSDVPNFRQSHVVVIPWSALEVKRTYYEGAVRVRLGLVQFRTNGLRVCSCSWSPRGGASDLEFVVPYKEEFQGATEAYMSLVAKNCLEITL